MPITALYAGLLAPLLIVLAARVIMTRRRLLVALGDGGKPELLRVMRVHANFIEFVPFALVLIGLAETVGTPPLIVHAPGLTLVAGRCVHAFGVSRPDENLTLRVSGMMATLTVIACAGIACIAGSLWRALA